MIYAKRANSECSALYVHGELTGSVSRKEDLAIYLNNPSQYLILLPLLTHLATTCWSDYMYITSAGSIYGVTEEEWEKMK